METEMEGSKIVKTRHSLMTNIYLSNIQILKNQRHLLQQLQLDEDPSEMVSTEFLIEETDNVLRIITDGRK